jgi:hypothetical protein
MLTETERGTLVDSIADNVVFEYGDYKPTVPVVRFGEGFKRHTPNIKIEFLPANRSKFRSISNAIGIASGEYVEYGFCQLEYVAFKCYCDEFHDDKKVSGRLLADHFLLLIRNFVLREWNHFLRGMGAVIDGFEEFAIRDVTAYQKKYATKIVVYELEIYLRTQFRWRKTPIDYVAPILEKIGVYYKEDKDEEYDYKEIEYEEE